MAKKKKYFYSFPELRQLQIQTERYGLDVPDGYYGLTLTQIREYANGCGSEAMSEIKRKALTSALKMYEPAFFIHDICYELMENREDADDMMRRNMITIMKHDFGTFWFLSKKGLVERFIVIPSVYTAVALCGGTAHDAAQETDDNNESNINNGE